MKRQFEVQMTCAVTLEIDDEVVSPYDGDTILTRHSNVEWQRNYYGDIGFDRSLMDLAVQVGIGGRSVGNVDGWADFSDDAASSHGFPDWELDHVREVTS